MALGGDQFRVVVTAEPRRSGAAHVAHRSAGHAVARNAVLRRGLPLARRPSLGNCARDRSAAVPVAANMARGADGRWTALDARHIYEHAKAGGSVYQAHLRAAVRERLPWASWGPERNGMAELERVPQAVVHEFSTRRRQILEREQELVAA